MSVSGHKSIASLAIYEKIHENEKPMMGLCLTYSLINPHNARRVQPANIEPLQLQTPKKQMIENATTKPIEVQSNAIVPLQSAVTPYTPLENKEPDPNFDLMELLSDTIDEVNNQELVLAATQCEQALVPTSANSGEINQNGQNVFTNTSVMKRNTPMTMFTNCHIDLIGTINIHFHKH